MNTFKAFSGVPTTRESKKKVVHKVKIHVQLQAKRKENTISPTMVVLYDLATEAAVEEEKLLVFKRV